MLLFVSPRNPLWAEILGKKKCTSAEVIRLLRLGHGTVPSWKKRNPIRDVTANKAFEEAKSRIQELSRSVKGDPKLSQTKAAECLKKVGEFESAYADQSMHMYDVASKILGMSIEDAQMVIDEAIYDRLPLLSTMFYGTPDRKESAVEEDFSKYQGVYEVSVQRYNKWLQCPLRVRYPIRIRDGIAMRCKLNAPIIEHSTIPYWEYDGFVAVKTHRLFWVFEKRDVRRSDYFFFITGLGSIYKDAFTLTGTYLTTDQDPLQSVASGDILLRRIPCKTSGEMEAMMHKRMGVIDEQPMSDELASLVTAFRKRRYSPTAN